MILFFIVFIILFSSLFTNFAGIREGLIGSISYWLEQHGVQRGNQPWYYYLLLLGAYETWPFVFGLAGTAYYLRRPTWLTSFLIWWWAVSLVIYSWAGEKMPWLIVHIALPLLLLAARYLGELCHAAPPATLWEQRIAFGGAAVLRPVDGPHRLAGQLRAPGHPPRPAGLHPDRAGREAGDGRPGAPLPAADRRLQGPGHRRPERDMVALLLVPAQTAKNAEYPAQLTAPRRPSRWC